MDTQHFLDQIGLAVDIRPPGGHADRQRLACAADGKAETGQDVGALGAVDIEAGEALDLGDREGDDFRLVALITDDIGPGGGATAEFQHQFGGALQARDHVFRIDAAFEAITRIGDDAERAAGAGDVHRIPQRRFDQHVGGVLVAARMLAAHDAADGFDAIVVGDDDVGGAELVFALVERQHGLALMRAADGQVALDLGGVEDMHRPALVEGHVVGNVDQRVDRTQADGN